MTLTPMENTAWLTVYCRYLQSRKKNTYLKDRVAEWLIDYAGIPDFQQKIKKRVLLGVPARSAAIDRLIREEIDTAQVKQFSWTYVAIGCGLDARWERFKKELGRSVGNYYEVDYANMLNYKSTLIRRSPYRSLYSYVKCIPCDLKNGLPDNFPDITSPALVVMEGIMMYLSEKEQIGLLNSIRIKMPAAVIIMDAYNAYAEKIANHTRGKFTGSTLVEFAQAPADPIGLYEANSWHIQRSISLIREMCCRNRSLLRFILLPGKITTSYLLIKMVTAT